MTINDNHRNIYIDMNLHLGAPLNLNLKVTILECRALQ